MSLFGTVDNKARDDIAVLRRDLETLKGTVEREQSLLRSIRGKVYREVPEDDTKSEDSKTQIPIFKF